ncbi:glutathione S-transferase class-mu 26 kDa isozyme 7-like [Ixodes scapularis]|uniref:glutathione S-transferase class-mu 26 kDa isozyme 7-like n=1 Tax=Ixodes scapularis TaxID=6945 RepID=UPI001C384A8C|nr:glutathione S-transferase class-mu 26 kDa isozyme 7-like [Ixodes scapularis]
MQKGSMIYLDFKWSVQEAAQLKDLEQWAQELSTNLAIAITTNPASGCLLNNYRKNMGSMLEPWAEYLEGRQWVLGTRLTYVDFLLYEAMNWHHELSPDAFLNHTVLMEYCERFREYPYRKKQSPHRHWR